MSLGTVLSTSRAFVEPVMSFVLGIEGEPIFHKCYRHTYGVMECTCSGDLMWHHRACANITSC